MKRIARGRSACFGGTVRLVDLHHHLDWCVRQLPEHIPEDRPRQIVLNWQEERGAWRQFGHAQLRALTVRMSPKLATQT